MAIVDGFTLGGFAEGSMQERQQNFVENQAAFEQEQATQEQVQERLSDTATRIKETVTGLLSQPGMTRDKVRKAVDPLVASGTQLLTAIGRDPTPFIEGVNSIVEATPTVEEAARAEGQGQAITQTAQAETLAGQEDVSRESARGAAGFPEPEPDQGTIIAQLQAERDQAIAEGRRNDAAQMQARIDRLTTITGRTEQDVAATASRATNEDEIRETANRLRSTTEDIEEVVRTGELFEQTPEAGGLLGEITEKVGGIAQQLADVANIPVDFVSDEVTEARTQARATVSRLLETITQEESGRFTEQERRLAQETLQSLRPESSARQISAAAATLEDIMGRSRMRAADKLLNDAQIDVNNEGGRQEAINILRDNGLTQEQALDTLADILSRRGVVIE